MRLELRRTGQLPPLGTRKQLLLILETPEESKLVDEVFGHAVDADGKIAELKGEVKLSNGYEEHYIRMERK